jgi:hypothetical protein
VTDNAISIAVIVFTAVALAVIVWWAVRAARESRVIAERMKAAAGSLQDFFAEEAAKYELVALYSMGPHANALERVQHINDSSAEWAELLFSRYAGTGAELAYDIERASWIAGVPLFEGGPLVAFTLDAGDAKKPMEALVAAVGVIVDDAPPVTESVERPSAVCVRYAQDKSRWEVYQACEKCGGGWLRTHLTDPSYASLARWTAQVYLGGADAEDTENDELLACADCLAREMRENERICHQPTCWYDTFTEQWMLTESLDEETNAVCVPLGIETFFVNQRVVLAAANQQLGFLS